MMREEFHHSDEGIYELLISINRKLEILMALSAEVQTLVDTVTANTNAVQGALAGYAGEATQIAALQAQLAAIAATGVPPSGADLAAITASVTTLQATNVALTTAVPANVAPAPVTPPIVAAPTLSVVPPTPA